MAGSERDISVAIPARRPGALTRMVTRALVPILKAPIARDAVVEAAPVHMPFRFAPTYLQRASAGGAIREGGVPFAVLRAMSLVHEPTRACIWKRRRQVEAASWELVAEGDSKNAASQLEEARRFFSTGGGLGGPGMGFRNFVAAAIEDVLVLDALSLYRQKNRGGGIYSLRLVDGGTIYPRGDPRGYTPVPPEAAYEQYVEGRKSGSYTTEEMRYYMLNPRTCSMFGLSPVECIIGTVEASLQASHWNRSWFDESNVPAGSLEVAATWTAKDVRDYQAYWDSMMSENTAQRHRLRVTPAGSKFVPYAQRSEMQFQEFQMWLLRLTCAMFDLNPAILGFAGEQYKVSQDQQIEAATKWGLQPLLLFLKDVFDDILAEDVGTPGVRFRWLPLETEDELKSAEAAAEWGSATLTINERRRRAGADPIEGEMGDMLFQITGQGIVYLGSTTKPMDEPFMPGPGEAAGQAGKPYGELGAEAGAEAARAAGAKADASAAMAPTQEQWREELRRFRRKAARMLARGERADVAFESSVLPGDLISDIQEKLYDAATEEEVEAAFKAAPQTPAAQSIEDEIAELPPARQREISEQQRMISEMAAGWIDEGDKFDPEEAAPVASGR